MPPFIASALALLARGSGIAGRGLFGTPARAGLSGVTAGSLLPDFGIPGFGFGGGGGGDRPRRRRRRRALTASDRADIGFITGLLGKAAGKEFAIVISTR